MTEASGIALEIERKYLLRSTPDEALDSQDYFAIWHGWIPGEVIQERITRNSRGNGEYWRCIKSGKGLTRIEAQEQISPELFDKLWPITEGKRVSKIRYKVQDQLGQLWEIDSFLDRKLFLAEIEIASADDKVVVPSWLAPHIVKEVTEDPSFLNINLAK